MGSGFAEGRGSFIELKREGGHKMKKRAIIVTAIFLVLSAALVLIDHRPIDATESQLIRIFGGVATGAGELRKPVRIEPPTLTVTKGGVVIWLNWARTAECVKVIFEEGKKCEDVTDSPTGFQAEGPCYVTTWITLGGTSSLKFNESGTYTYTVEAKAGAESYKETGRIVVQ
jgi:hypothetical protein